MGTTFLQRNKKKSLAALLLLLLRSKRSLGPVLVMVMLLMLVFMAPSNLAGYMLAGLKRLPGGERAAAVIGRVAMSGKKPLFNNLMAALKAARDDKHAGWGVFQRPVSASKGDSLNMVRGSVADLLRRNARNSDSPRTINGVLTPEDSADSEQGVALTAEELTGQGGFVRAAEAGMLAGAAWAGKSAGSAPYPGAGLFSRDGATANAGDNVATALGSATVPVAAHKVNGEGGKLSNQALRASAIKRANAANANAIRNGKALRQLSDGRARSQVARDPACSAQNSCPGEYASTNSGAVYDGNRIGLRGAGSTLGGISGVEEIGEGPPQIPDDSALQREIDRATKLQEDARKCQEADARYRPIENDLNRQLWNLSGRMYDRGCMSYGSTLDIFSQLLCFVGIGDCGKRKACKRMANEMIAICNQLNATMALHYNSCPLHEDPFQPTQCR